MGVPTQLSDLSATAASNSPAGGDTVGTTMDDYLRAIQSIIVRISAGTDAMATPALGAPTAAGRISANLGLTVAGGTFVSRGITDSATAVALTLSGSGANSVTIANSATNPTIGTSAGAISFNPIAQGEVLRVTTGGASTVNYWSLSGALTGSRLTLLATGSDANVGASWQTKGSGSHLFVTETGASAQVEIQHTASATRYLTLTGSNGGNPTIGTSAGALNIASGAGNVTINAGAAALNAALSVTCTGVSGCAIQLVGNGATTPNKFIRSFSGNLEIVDSGFAAAIVKISDVGSIAANTATAIPAGGTAGVGLKVSSTANFGVFFGSGAPSLSAAKGSIYLRSDGSTTNNRMYVNTDGGTTWTAVTTAA